MSSVFESVFDVVEDVADFIVEDIFEPVVDAVSDVVEGIADDPITFIATAVAAVYAPWAIPLVSAASTAAQGGDIGDIILSAAASYVGAQVVGPAVGKYASSYVGPNVGAAVGRAAGQATTAVITGEDPVRAFLTAGAGAAVSAGLGYISEQLDLPTATTVSGGTAGVPGPIGVPGVLEEIPFFDQYPEVKAVIAGSLSKAISGEDVTAGTVLTALAKAQITTELVNQQIQNVGFDAIEDAGYLAFITNTINDVVGATFDDNQDVSDTLLASINQYGTQELNEVLDGVVRSTINQISSEYEELQTANSEGAELTNAHSRLQEQHSQVQSDYNYTVDAYNDAVAMYTPQFEESGQLLEVANQAAEDFNAKKSINDAAREEYDRRRGEFDTAVEDRRNTIRQHNRDVSGLQDPSLVQGCCSYS